MPKSSPIAAAPHGWPRRYLITAVGVGCLFGAYHGAQAPSLSGPAWSTGGSAAGAAASGGAGAAGGAVAPATAAAAAPTLDAAGTGKGGELLPRGTDAVSDPSRGEPAAAPGWNGFVWGADETYLLVLALLVLLVLLMLLVLLVLLVLLMLLVLLVLLVLTHRSRRYVSLGFAVAGFVQGVSGFGSGMVSMSILPIQVRRRLVVMVLLMVLLLELLLVLLLVLLVSPERLTPEPLPAADDGHGADRLALRHRGLPVAGGPAA